MDKPDGLSRRLKEKKSGMDTHFFNEGKLRDLADDNVGEEEDADDE